jgi:hypothetical protein
MDPKTRKFPSNRTTDQGWGLLETLLGIALSAIILGVVSMGARQALDGANGHDCSKNLALIEAAKDEFTRDNPGVPLTSDAQLAKYLKYGIPKCPSGGTYAHVVDLGQTTSCSLGTNPGRTNYHIVGP